MSRILLSINPQYVNQIIKGYKKFEFRKKVAKRKVDKIIVYSTSPVKKVIAEVEVKSIISAKPKELWALTNKFAGVSQYFYEKYFQDRDIAYAYELGIVEVYDNPKDLSEFGCKMAPQSFIYLDN